MNKGIVVLISGRGSNLQAIYNKGLCAEIKCVISNKKDALGIQFAKEHGLNTKIIEHTTFPTREEFDQQLANEIDQYSPKLIVLAGFMRILSSWFIKRYEQKIINIHPSILPSFIGANAQADAFNAKVKVSGATVHYVTDILDHGPILAQGIIATADCNNKDDLAKRILDLEHTIYPFIINKILNNAVDIDKNYNINIEYKANDKEFLGKYKEHIFY